MLAERSELEIKKLRSSQVLNKVLGCRLSKDVCHSNADAVCVCECVCVCVVVNMCVLHPACIIIYVHPSVRLCFY